MTQPTDIRRAVVRPRLLDLCCCQGGAGKRYAQMSAQEVAA
ncbi:hypothetical protein [Streptomyces albus]|nr:hypothetical protein [Streptomyces sp. NRRL F-5917]